MSGYNRVEKTLLRPAQDLPPTVYIVSSNKKSINGFFYCCIYFVVFILCHWWWYIIICVKKTSRMPQNGVLINKQYLNGRASIRRFSTSGDQYFTPVHSSSTPITNDQTIFMIETKCKIIGCITMADKRPLRHFV